MAAPGACDNSFWEAFRTCAERGHRITPDHARFYVQWAQQFQAAGPGVPLQQRTGQQVEEFLETLGHKIAPWQVSQARAAMRVLYEDFLPHYRPSPVVGTPAAPPKTSRATWRDTMLPGEVGRRYPAELQLLTNERLPARPPLPVRPNEAQNFLRRRLRFEVADFFFVPRAGGHDRLGPEIDMNTQQRFGVARPKLVGFCRRHHIRKLSFFGSVLRDDFRSDSDVDVLVEFDPGPVPGLLRLSGMELEFSELLGRKVDLMTPNFFGDPLRERILSESEIQYDEAG